MSKKTKTAPAATATPTPAPQPQIQELSPEQEINALRAAHQFFGNFPNVPGHAAANWGQALDALAIVANSLIKKAGLLGPSAPTDESQPSA
mgnify:CR=1 FL=1